MNIHQPVKNGEEFVAMAGDVIDLTSAGNEALFQRYGTQGMDNVINNLGLAVISMLQAGGNHEDAALATFLLNFQINEMMSLIALCLATGVGLSIQEEIR